jgi:ADP-ribosylglycohydrolase
MYSSLESAFLSLEGLSVGDSFGEYFFNPSRMGLISTRTLPEGIWHWTDDTHMAISIVEVLGDFGHIEQDALAKRFADRFSKEPYRGYGSGAFQLLTRLAQGKDWRELSPVLFNGGSFGNGAAMRAAPIGGFFKGNPERTAEEARKSAVITHYHNEGQAGAIAVAVAASIAGSKSDFSRDTFLESILLYLPESEVKNRIKKALRIAPEKFYEAAYELGTGMEVSAQDTVPFCLWCAANNLYDFESALWQTVSGFGDRDTTCAIVGGIVALSSGFIPQEWVNRREELPKIH